MPLPAAWWTTRFWPFVPGFLRHACSTRVEEMGWLLDARRGATRVEESTLSIRAARYSANPHLTTVIEGGSGGANTAETGARVKAVPEMRVEM